MFFKEVQGTEGEIRIPELGAVIGQFRKWKLAKEVKGDDTATGFYVFRAELKYINQALFNDRDYEHAIIVTTGRDRRARTKRQYRLELAEGRTANLKGRSLLMEGVRICQLES